MEEFGFSCCAKLVSSHWCCKWRHQYCIFSLRDYFHEFVLDTCMCEECAPSLLVSILPGRSIFGNSLGRVKDTASVNIQYIIYLCSSLMWNDSTVCGGRIEVIFCVRDCSEMLMFLESDSTMMFSVTLMCWEYIDTLLLTIFQPNYRATVSWPPSFTGSRDALFIQPRALELYVKDRTSYLCPSCWIVMWIETSKARNYRRFSVSTPYHSRGMYNCHAIHLSL